MKKNKVKLTENGLKKLIKESTAKILKEMETENVPYEAWSEYLHGKEPLFEFEDGIIYVDYDENNGTLCSGHVTNVGFHKDGEVEVPVYDGDFQAALEEVYDQLSCNHEGLCENKGRKSKLTKSHLQKIINENIKKVLKEGSKKKDPMAQWFNDFNKASKYRETMDYVNKGGRNPLSKNKNENLNEGDVRFIPHLQRDIETLHSLYEKWQYAENKPEGIDDFIDAVLNAKHIMQDIKSSLSDCEY